MMPPNVARYRIAVRLWMLPKLKGLGGAARGALER